MAKDRLISKEDREKALEEIQRFFEEERGETLGIVAAVNIYEFFYETLGRDLCRKVLDRYRDRMILKLEDAEAEILGDL